MKVLKVSHLTEIGRVVTTWAIVDFSLQALAADLTLGRHVDYRNDKDDSAASIPFVGMGTRAMVGLIQSLLQVRHADEVDAWKKIGKAINDAKAQRDIVAHCVWAAGDTPEQIHPMGAKTVGGLKGIKDEQLHIHDLTDRAALNIQLSNIIWSWRIRLGYLDALTAEEFDNLEKDPG